MSAQSVAPIGFDDKQVVDVPRRRRPFLKDDVADALELGSVRPRVLATPLVPAGKMRKLDAEECSLESVESRVHPLDHVVVLPPLAVVPQSSQALFDRGIVGRHHAGVAVGAEVLRGVEAEAGGLPE